MKATPPTSFTATATATTAVIAVVSLLLSTSGAELIRQWTFEGSFDDSVEGDVGTPIGGATFGVDRFDRPNAALAVDGLDLQYVSVEEGGGLDALETGTIAFWVRWDGIQNQGFGSIFGPVLSRQSNGLWSNHIIGLNDADPEFATVVWRPYAAGVAAISLGWPFLVTCWVIT